MSNTKKISYKNIAAKLPAAKSTLVKLEGEIFEGMTAVVKERLSLSELNALITDVVNTLVDMQAGEYNPEYADLVKMMLQLKHYAGVTIGKNDLSYAYRVLNETDLYTQLMAHVDVQQLHDAMAAVDERVEFMQEMILSTAGHKAVEMLTQLEQLMGTMESVSAEMSGDKMQQLLGALGELTGMAAMPQALMEAATADEPVLLAAAE